VLRVAVLNVSCSGRVSIYGVRVCVLLTAVHFLLSCSVLHVELSVSMFVSFMCKLFLLILSM
jgi:hypothetical protein